MPPPGEISGHRDARRRHAGGIGEHPVIERDPRRVAQPATVRCRSDGDEHQVGGQHRAIAQASTRYRGVGVAALSAVPALNIVATRPDESLDRRVGAQVDARSDRRLGQRHADGRWQHAARRGAERLDDRHRKAKLPGRAGHFQTDEPGAHDQHSLRRDSQAGPQRRRIRAGSQHVDARPVDPGDRGPAGGRTGGEHHRIGRDDRIIVERQRARGDVEADRTSAEAQVDVEGVKGVAPRLTGPFQLPFAGEYLLGQGRPVGRQVGLPFDHHDLAVKAMIPQAGRCR